MLARSFVVASVLEGTQTAPGGECPVRRLVEETTGQMILYGAPTEVFSQHMPQYHPTPGEDDLFPIDILYGAYSSDTALATTFIRRIESHASLYGSSPDDLTDVVRIHEYAHAVVHLGIDSKGTKKHLNHLNANGITDWAMFRKERDHIYRNLPRDVHEFLAQAITWACICKRCRELASDTLVETFVALEQRQPAEYSLPLGTKAAALFTDWPMVLQAARDKEWFCLGPTSCLREVLAALVIYRGRPSAFDGLDSDDGLSAISEEVQATLDAVDVNQKAQGSARRDLEFLIARKGHVELRMYKEAAHARPHFHIEYKREYAASYALNSFELLAGFMPRKYEEPILALAKAQADRLLELWTSTNGARTGYTKPGG